MDVRRYVSKADVARCSFKDKAIEEVDVFLVRSLVCDALILFEAISLAYQVAINAIIEGLRRFAGRQQYVHSSGPICTPLIALEGTVLSTQATVQPGSSK